MEIANKLTEMIRDEANQDRHLYSAGPYWKNKTRKIINQIRKKGIADFRGYDSGVGTSFCDNIITDIRNEYDWGIRRLIYKFTYLYPFNQFFYAQKKVAVDLHSALLSFKQKVYEKNGTLKNLLQNYSLSNSTSFGCVDKISFNNEEYSCHYLELLNTHNQIAKSIDFNKIFSMFEIGGGFGANVHILLQNYKSIKKIFYLDIVPNLIVGTEYLKSIYGDSVVEYKHRNKADIISFSDNNKLEIICIAPWQIEQLISNVDYVHNAHSFVEMPKYVVDNYLKHINRMISEQSRIAFVSYIPFDKNTNFDQNAFNSTFNNKIDSRNFISQEHMTLLEDKMYYYLIR